MSVPRANKPGAKPKSDPRKVEGDGYSKCYGLLINGSPDLEDSEDEQHWAAKRLKDQGCTVYAATIDRPEDADIYAKPTPRNVLKLLKQIGKRMDGDDDFHLYVNTHGLPNSIYLLNRDLARKALVRKLKKLHFAKMAVILANCFGGNWQRSFIGDPRILFVSQGSRGEDTWEDEFTVWSDWDSAPDVDLDGRITYWDVFKQQSEAGMTSKPVYLAGLAYEDTGIENPASFKGPFEDKVVSIKTPEELNQRLAKLKHNEYAVLKCLSDKGKEGMKSKTLFEQQARGAHGRYGFFLVEGDDLSMYPQCDAGASKLFGLDLPTDGLPLGKDGKFAMNGLLYTVLEAKERAMSKAIASGDWKEAARLLDRAFHDGSYHVVDRYSNLIAIADETQSGPKRIPDGLISSIVEKTDDFDPSMRAFRRLILRKGSEKQIHDLITDADLPEEFVSGFCEILLYESPRLSKKLLADIAKVVPEHKTTLRAFARLLAMPGSDEEVAEVLAYAAASDWGRLEDDMLAMVDTHSDAKRYDVKDQVEEPIRPKPTPPPVRGSIQTMAMKNVNGMYSFQIAGSCTTDEDAKALTRMGISQSCPLDRWLERTHDQDSYLCKDGAFYSVLEGSCK